ncbi:PEP-CTERM sorting domain-containing protein [Verrucomicrobium sp. BvORR106]|uniref:PEP-CTERM sorting domain-containing protein n=1 Tax=Verrucomicrobium sp. BvORR106 TaxID=1403819 RepID=UPI000A4C96DE|nr:PEP-CTERM sorting domain-containing protein [Verrucomicrobium sp. BvORR106]
MLLFAGAGQMASAAAVILANSPNANGQPNTNANLPATFGDNVSLAAPGSAVFATSAGVVGVTGTPDIGLTWSATGGSSANAWQSHAWTNAGGGALQMDGSQLNSTYSITFTPTATTGVVLGGFNFIGDTNNDSYQYRVDVVNLMTSQTVFTASTDLWTTNRSLGFNNAPAVNIDYTGELGVAYRMDLVRIGGTGTDGSTAGSSPVDIAIDNLRFDQVPEPSRVILLGLAALACVGRRGKLRVRS